MRFSDGCLNDMAGKLPSWLSASVAGWFSRTFNRFINDAEFNQSVVRFPISILVVLYAYVFAHEPQSGLAGTAFRTELMLIAAYYLLSIALLIVIYRWPGIYWQRRLFAMMIDYFAVTFFLVIGGEKMVPVFAALVWITVGNGLRYGQRYLGVALCFALLSTGAVILLNPLWRDNVYLSAAFVLIVLMVPGYASALLARTSAAEHAAKRATADKSGFLAQASHDLRQPIHTIGLLSAQLSESRSIEHAHHTAMQIARATRSAASMMQTFLDVSIIESGSLAAHHEPVRLDELFDDLQRQNKLDAEWGGVSLRFVPTKRVVFTDPTFLKTIVQNLISNAIKYAPGRRVLVGARPKHGTTAIMVCDTGPGIAEDQLDRIGEAFYRGSGGNRSKAEGSGLGLSIVKRLAHLAELEFDIRSQPGRGTTAVIGGLSPAHTTPEHALPPSGEHNRQLSGLRVMFVDDDLETRAAATGLLEQWGCVTETHHNPPEGIGSNEVVLSDFQFDGGKNLTDFPAFLKAADAARASLVVITGNDVNAVRRSLKNADTLILSKPLQPAELRSVLMAMRVGA